MTKKAFKPIRVDKAVTPVAKPPVMPKPPMPVVPPGRKGPRPKF